VQKELKPRFEGHPKDEAHERRRLKEPRLDAIVCPLTEPEVPRAIANMHQWNKLIASGEAPLDSSDSKRTRLIFSFNCSEKNALAGLLKKEFSEQEQLLKAFSGIEIQFCDLSPEKDVYVKDPGHLMSPYGNKAGPNWLFYETMKKLRANCDFVFLMETDCEPLTPNWLQRLARTCARAGDAWIVGSPYRGVSLLPAKIARHLNGNAFYRIGDPAFWEFLDELLWPWMLTQIPIDNYGMAYDCAWEYFLHRPEFDDPTHPDWQTVRDLLHRFQATNAVVNIGGRLEQRRDYIWTKGDVLKRFPGIAVVHGPVSHTTEHIRNGIAFSTLTLTNKTHLDSDSASVSFDEAAKFQRVTWLPGRSFEPGMTLRIAVEFDAAPGLGLLVELRGNGPPLERQRLKPQRGTSANRLELSYEFIDRRPFVRVIVQKMLGGKEPSLIKILQSTCEVSLSTSEVKRRNDLLK
jgi:hypothetical protein